MVKQTKDEMLINMMAEGRTAGRICYSMGVSRRHLIRLALGLRKRKERVYKPKVKR